MIEKLLVIFRPYKYELLIFALFFLTPLVSLISTKFKKFQSFILIYCIWMMHRWEGFETVTFFYTRMRGSQYGISIHHVDIFIPAIFFACVLNRSLAGRIKLPGLDYFYSVFFSYLSFLQA